MSRRHYSTLHYAHLEHLEWRLMSLHHLLVRVGETEDVAENIATLLDVQELVDAENVL